MLISTHVTSVLTPHLGAFTADTVARHVCAKLQITDSATPEQLEHLREYLRRGLVAYVGPEVADDLAARCVAAGVFGRPASG
jgi:hypothetical protein